MVYRVPVERVGGLALYNIPIQIQSKWKIKWRPNRAFSQKILYAHVNAMLFNELPPQPNTVGKVKQLLTG